MTWNKFQVVTVAPLKVVVTLAPTYAAVSISNGVLKLSAIAPLFAHLLAHLLAHLSILARLMSALERDLDISISLSPLFHRFNSIQFQSIQENNNVRNNS
jgi:hypothetical protein